MIFFARKCYQPSTLLRFDIWWYSFYFLNIPYCRHLVSPPHSDSKVATKVHVHQGRPAKYNHKIRNIYTLKMRDHLIVKGKQFVTSWNYVWDQTLSPFTWENRCFPSDKKMQFWVFMGIKLHKVFFTGEDFRNLRGTTYISIKINTIIIIIIIYLCP